jgi:hypothetical protein
MFPPFMVRKLAGQSITLHVALKSFPPAPLVKVLQAPGPRSTWFGLLQVGHLSAIITVTERPLAAPSVPLIKRQAPQAKPFW